MWVHILGPLIGGALAGYTQIKFTFPLEEMKKLAYDGDTCFGAEDSDVRRKGTQLQESPHGRTTTNLKGSQNSLEL